MLSAKMMQWSSLCLSLRKATMFQGKALESQARPQSLRMPSCHHPTFHPFKRILHVPLPPRPPSPAHLSCSVASHLLLTSML